MNEKWIEIFIGGQQRDSKKQIHDGDKLIDDAVAKFNAAHFKPPITIGHSDGDKAPAYGWIGGLKTEIKNGVKTLLAKCEDVMPEFAEIVRAGRYRNKSAAFYPDGGLQHLAFLGATPPAVKGLNVEFKEIPIIFEFMEEKTVEDVRNAMSHLLETVANFNIGGDMDKDTKSAEQVTPVVTPAINFSEMENKLRAEFAEKEKTLRQELRKKEYENYIDRMKYPPVFRDMGIIEFMTSLDHEKVITFSENSANPQSVWFKSFLEKLVTLNLFSEFAVKGKTNQDNLDEKTGIEIAGYVNGGK